ncbi:PAS domain S-box protein [Thiovibrio sp. JS02]
MSMKKRFVAIPLLIILTTHLLFLLYSAVKKQTLDEFNSLQMVYAKQAATGIENLFGRFSHELSYLAEIDDIVRCTDRGKTLMELFFRKNKDALFGITRMDAQGIIRYTFPVAEGAVGASIAGQPHVAELLKNKQPVVSDVFAAVQGPLCIALHVPVLRDGVFAGSLALLIPFDKIAREYLAPIRIGSTGQAWMISEGGRELYAMKPGDVGKSIFETHRNSPSLLSVSREMMLAKEGVGSFLLPAPAWSAGSQKQVLHHAAYAPARLGNTIWAIAVSTAEQEVLKTMERFRSKWLFLFGALLLGALTYAGLILKAWAATRETDKRKRALDALKKSRRDYRQLVESANSIILRWDPNGDILYLNPYGLDFFGFSEQEIIGRNVMGSIVPETETSGRDLSVMIEDILHYPGKYKNNINQNCKRSGERVWISWTNEAILGPDGGLAEILSIGNDVTALKKAEAALSAEKEFTDFALNAQPDSFFVFNSSSGRAVRWNKAFREACGYSDAEIAQLLAPHSYYRDEDLQKAEEALVDLYLNKSATYQLQLLTKKGETIPFEYHATLFEDGKDKEKFVVSIGRDISERIRAEEEKEKLEIDLRQAHKMEAIGTLAGGIAHDFNNILTVILGYAELGRRFSQGQTKLSEYLEQISKATHRAKELVNQILAFSRKSESKLRPLSLYPLAHEALQLLRSSIPSSIEIVSDLDMECGITLADPTQIQQIIMNLCTNAVHAMEKESGQLGVILARRKFSNRRLDTEDITISGDFIELCVSDTGHGMDEETMEHIFDPYFTTKEVGKGSGMGLSVVHGIVHGLGGTIRVSSSPGKGSVFRIYLPVVDAPASEANEESELADLLPPGRERILFVDDENAIVDIHKVFWAELGYAVEAVTDSRTALQRFQATPHRFDLVITDQTMPNLSGADMAVQMLRLRPELPIILCTGYSNVISEEDALSLGIRKFIMKPVGLQELAKLVREIFEAKETPPAGRT